MKNRILVLALTALWSVYASENAMSQPILRYVSPQGSDTWSGTLPAPNRARTDGPFATLSRAQQAVRELTRTGKPVTVQLRGGFYALTEPLHFTWQDSGTKDAPVRYEAFGKEKPIVSGGVRLTGWKMDTQGRWTLTLPEVRDGKWRFTQLFVNDERRYRPRLPKQGYYQIEADLPPSPAAKEQGFDRFQFAEGQIRADWHNISDVEALPFHIWTMSRFPIASVDAQKHIVTFFGKTSGTAWWASMPRGNRFLVENVREALSEPGEWYLDYRTGELTYLPRPGEQPEAAVVIAPRLEALLLFQGDIGAKRPVQYLAFKGITFAHTNWVTPTEGQSFPQAEANLNSAIQAVGMRDCTFMNCRLTHIGTYGMDFGAACKRITIENCEITDLGAGGIKIGTMDYSTDEEQVASQIRVRNCRIAHGGRMHPAGIGVWIGHANYNVITQNDIYDFYYTGVSVGWRWGYDASNSHHNEISYNHIYLIGQEVLSDMGGIYTLGPAEGTVLRYNLIHDVRSTSYGGWGIYFDEGTTGILAENNVVYNTKSAGFHQHYGKENRVVNNIFAFGEEAQLMRTRAEDHLSFTLERNIILYDNRPLLGSNWSGSNYRLTRNLYWNLGSEPVRFLGATLADWQSKGQDTGSLIADPGFTAPRRGDFRLKADSPAARIGFVPIDLSRTGRQAAGTPRTSPIARRLPPRSFDLPPQALPPSPIRQDFEEIPTGGKLPGATVYEENAEATIRVTEETAFSGKRSLKFIDKAGQQAGYNPHCFFVPNFKDVRLRGRFALRWEEGAVFYHEWRTDGTPYIVGPSVRVSADGTLTAGGRTLMRLTPGRWTRFEILCGVGKASRGTYTLSVQEGDAAPRRFTDLPCQVGFRAVNWFGFVADGTTDAVFYLDDILLEPIPN
jgi:hypothetical protein